MVHNRKCVTIFQNQCLLRLQYLPIIEILNRTKGFLTYKYSINDDDCMYTKFYGYSELNLSDDKAQIFFGSCYYKLAHVSCLGTIWSNDFFLQNQETKQELYRNEGDIYSSRLLQYNKSETLSLEKEAFIVFLSTSLGASVFVHLVSKSLRGLRGTINEKAKRDLISSPFIHSKRSKVTLKWSPLLLPFRKQVLFVTSCVL